MYVCIHRYRYMYKYRYTCMYTYIILYYIICTCSLVNCSMLLTDQIDHNNNNWSLYCVSCLNSNLEMATIYLVFFKSKNIYIKLRVKLFVKQQDMLNETYCLKKGFNMLFQFTI